jgi:hypothetical protein
VRRKPELTKKRHQIDVLLKRAMKGGKQAKDKLYKEFGIRVYSSEEVEKYVAEKLETEVVEESPLEVSAKAISKRKNKQMVKKR